MTVRRPLTLETDTNEATVGEPVTVRVRDWNKPVEGATVSTRTKKTRTDSRGRCQLTFHAPGFWKITAVKSPGEYVAYKPATKLIRAVTKPATSQRLHRIVAQYE